MAMPFSDKTLMVIWPRFTCLGVTLALWWSAVTSIVDALPNGCMERGEEMNTSMLL